MMRSVVLLLLGALLLGGCATVPTSGPVEQVPVTAEAQGVDFAPEPPPAGVSQRGAVEGFLQALASPESDYAVARKYLSAAALKVWEPNKNTRIYEGGLSQDGENIKLSGLSVGEVDQDGHFVAEVDYYNHDFGMVQQDGEWRINNPPIGIILSKYLFERYYAHVPVYFMSVAGPWVIPELIHVPESRLTPNRILAAQLLGPSDEISGIARNAIPDGVRLGAEGASVAAADGIVTVDLENISKDLSDQEKRELGAQLLWSLTAIPRITGMKLTTEKGSYPLPGQSAEGTLELATQQGFQVLSRTGSIDLLGISEQAVGRVVATGSFLPLSNRPAAIEVAVSLDGTQIALLGEKRDEINLGPFVGELKTRSFELTNLRRLQYSLGELWFLAGNRSGETVIVRIDQQGKHAIVELDQLGGRIVDFSMSPSGSRAAAVIEASDRTKKLVTFILEDAAAPKIAKVQPLIIFSGGKTLENYSNIDWSGESRIAIIAEVGSQRSVFLANIDGSQVENLNVGSLDPSQVAALPRLGSAVLAVRTVDSLVYDYDPGSRWSQLGEKISQIAYPG